MRGIGLVIFAGLVLVAAVILVARHRAPPLQAATRQSDVTAAVKKPGVALAPVAHGQAREPLQVALRRTLEAAHLSVALDAAIQGEVAVEPVSRPPLAVLGDLVEKHGLAFVRRPDGLCLAPRQPPAGPDPESLIVPTAKAIAMLRANDFQRGTALFRPRDPAELDAIVRDLRAATSSEIRVAATNPALGVVKLSFPEAYPVMQVVAALRRDPRVENPEPNYRAYQLGVTPNDPGFAQQWHLAKVRCPEAWTVTQGSPAVIIAIVDTGIDYDHPDLAGDGSHVIKGWDFVNNDADPMDDEGHGTHCAGIAAGLGNNGVGICGVAFQCRLMAVKVMDNNGSGYYDDVAQGIQYAADHGASIISLSLGGDVESGTLTAAVDYAFGQGCLVVAAAGNDGIAFPSWPAACRNAMAIAATDSNDQRATFSTYGQTLDLAAPGVDIYSTIWNDSYTNASGTSMATPCVAGVAGLMKSAFPWLSAAQLREKLWQSTNATTWTDQLGYGRIDAALAVGVSADFALAKMASPETAAWVGRQVKVRGTAAAADLAGFAVEWSPDGGQWYTTGMTLAHGGTQNVEEDWLATWDATGQATGDYTLRLTVTSRGGMVATNSIRLHLDTRILPGWPQATYAGNSYGWNAPVITDIDGDGRNEVIATDIAAVCYVWDGEGNMKPGWPQFGISTTPAVADFDGDGKKEIVGHFESSDPEGPDLFGYRYDGTPMPGFPKDIGWPWQPIVADDIDQDGRTEMLVCLGGMSDGAGGYRSSLHALRADGTEPAGWPVGFVGNLHCSLPVVADLDGDGDKEIMFGNKGGWSTDFGKIYIYHHDGRRMCLLDKSDHGYDWFWQTPAVGDVNGDGQYELVMPCNRGIRVFTSAGTELLQFAIESEADYGQNGLALADLDGDGLPNIIAISSNSGRSFLHVTDRNGSELAGWPVDLSAAGLTYYYQGACPVAGDVNGDGELEIAISLNLGGVGVFSRAGQLLQRFQFRAYPYTRNQESRETLALGDVDGDGSTDLVVAQNKPGSLWYDPGAVFALSLGGPSPAGPLPWPGLGTQHGLANRWYRMGTDNLKPVAFPLHVLTPVNQPVAITLIGHDDEGAPLTYGVASQPAHGTLTGVAPNLTYTPAAGYHGMDAFTYQVNDGRWDSLAATVSIIVNDAPVAPDQAVGTNEDTAVPVTLSATDANSDPLTYSIVTAPAHGTLSGSGPTRTYTPAANYYGADSFTFKANDGLTDSNVATVSVTIAPVNDAPVVQSQSAGTAMNIALPMRLAATDADNDPLTFAIVAEAAHGTLTGAAPNLTYTPAANYFGPDSFSFKANDGQQDSNTATVTIWVSDVVAQAVTISTLENAPVPVGLVATDASNHPLTYTIVAGPRHGTLSGAGAARTYSPTAGYLGLDSFTYKANDGIADSNVATVAITVLSRCVVAGVQVQKVTSAPENFDLRVTDTAGHSLTCALETPPAHGSVVLDGVRASYTPETGFCGVDSFTYTARDVFGSWATARVWLRVQWLEGQWPTYGHDAARTGHYHGNLGNGLAVPVWSVGYVKPLHAVPAAAGQVFVLHRKERMVCERFVAALDDATGTETWRHTFAACDTVSGATYDGGRLYAQRANYSYDSQLWCLNAGDGQPLWSAPYETQHSLFYAPAVADGAIFAAGGYYGGMYGFEQANGAPRFSVSLPMVNWWTPSYLPGRVITWIEGVFREHDPQTGAVRWSVDCGWDPAADSHLDTVAALDAGQAFVVGWTSLIGFNLSAQAKAWEVPGSFTGSPAVAHGVVYAVSGSTVKAYRVADGTLIASYDASEALRGQSLVLDDALIAASDVATYIWRLSQPAPLQRLDGGGALSLADAMLYVAQDGEWANNSLLAYLITGTGTTANHPPQANDVPLPVVEDTSASVSLPIADADADPLTVTIVSWPAHGQAILEGTRVTYTPAPNYFGPDALRYQVFDGQAYSRVATVSIVVTPVNEPPFVTSAAWANPNPVLLSAGTTVQVVAGDPDGDTLNYAWSQVSGDGTATFATPTAPDSTVTFTALGTYLLRVTIADGQGLSLTSDVRVRVIRTGHIIAWGRNDYGQCDVPSPNTDFLGLAAGSSHGLGLKSDGSVVAWGRNDYQQATLPSPNTGFTAIAANYDHNLGLKSDGSLVAWGKNVWRQCNIPSPNSGFIGVAGGNDHSLGLKNDGSVVAWGRDNVGQGQVPSPNSGFTAIAAGAYFSLGLKNDGSLVAWGDNGSGQCTVPSPNTGFTAVAAGWYHSLGLKSDGSIVAWGDTFFGKCNVPSPNCGFTAIAAGYNHSFGLQPEFTNEPPTIDSPAWADPNPVTLPAGTTVHVVASDPDGDPLTYAWTKVSGPGTATFAAPAAANGGVTFSAAGVYVLRVTVSDGRGGSATSDVTVTVNAGVDARADVNHDGVVNALDLQIVIANFGQSVGAPGCDVRADANADGVVNALDLQIVIANFGMTVP